jgi:hypothetical protein
MIVGYTGLVGMGKTMLATREAVNLARRRRAILVSNIEVIDPGVPFVQLAVGDDGLEGLAPILRSARACGVCTVGNSRGKVAHGEDGCERQGVVILVDEIGIILPARFWERGMSITLMWACSQSRKLGADLIFTCQHVAQLDAFLRRITDWIWKVKAIPHPSVERREAGKRPWFFWTTRWRPADIDTENPEKRLSRSFRWYHREDEGIYDTDELVTPPAHLTGTPGASRGRRVRSSGPIQGTGAGPARADSPP